MNFGEFLYSLLVIFFMIVYFMMLFSIIIDIFRSHDMGGLAKALWLIFLFIIPFFSLIIYVIVRGQGMSKRNQQGAEEAQAAQLEYAKKLVAQNSGSHVDQIANAQKLLESGAISQAEFDQIKAKVLAS